VQIAGSLLIAGLLIGERASDGRNTKAPHADYVLQILRALDPEESPEKITIATACERLIEDCKSRHLARETIGKYELLSRELKEFFKGMRSSWTSASENVDLPAAGDVRNIALRVDGLNC
jgi:hypothetical protein